MGLSVRRCGTEGGHVVYCIFFPSRHPPPQEKEEGHMARDSKSEDGGGVMGACSFLELWDGARRVVNAVPCEGSEQAT